MGAWAYGVIVSVQRVKQASVSVNNAVVGAIERGLLLLVAVDESDVSDDTLTIEPIDRLAQKVSRLRVFPTDGSHFGASLSDVDGSALCISQFTLPGRTRKGTKPSFEKAADAKFGLEGYQYFCQALAQYVGVQTGEFGADMTIQSTMDGPVTLLLGTNQAEAPWLS